jgi:hypothetical protein
MRSWWALSLGCVLAASAAWGQSATLSISPRVLTGAPGSLVDVPVNITTADRVSIVRFTLEYNSSAAVFQSVRVGTDAAAASFTIPAFNPNLSFPPSSPGTNDNVLVLLMSGSSTWITGTNKQLAVLTFQLASGGCKQTPLNFDTNCNHTDGATFQGDYLCGSNFQLRSGVLANGCSTDVPAAGAGRFVLHQNVPNPFNPITTIALELATESPVTLQVFSVDGNRVRVLIDAVLPAGPHQAIWNGTDMHGNPVPSGVYYCQLRVGDAVASQPMVLLK